MLLLLATLFSTFYPLLHAKKITFYAAYPKELPAVYLRGDGCGLNWDAGVKMALSSSNTTEINQILPKKHQATTSYTWKYELDCSSEKVNDVVEVKVLVNDKTWMLGSNHHLQITDQPSAEDTVYPWFYTYEGTTQIISRVYSKELSNFRDVIFYLPPSYTENTLKVHKNILVMHDGQNLFDPRTSAFGAWMCQDTLNEGIIEGKYDEVLIVGPYNTPDRTNEYTYIYDPSEKAGGKGDLYLDWIESTLLPLVESSYRVKIERGSLGILGSSLGGLISCYAGWTRSNIYGRVGCMSSSFWWDENDYQNKVITSSTPVNKSPLPTFYVDSGTAGGDGSCAVYTTQVYNYYLTVGFEEDKTVFKYIDEGGEHNEASWGARFYLPMQALYPSNTV